MDNAKGWMMRAIMFWFWEHGLNALRALPAMSFRDTLRLFAPGMKSEFGSAWALVKRNDPAMLEMAKFGVNFHTRPDFGVHAKAFESAMSKLQSQRVKK